MKRNFCLFVAALCALCVGAVGHRALLIGIGDYPEASGWNAISGDNDVSYAQKIALANGFKMEDITSLINEKATKKTIVKELENMISSAELGDVCYIHFSGHGQRVTDIDGDEDANDSKWDEAWVCYDAKHKFDATSYRGENHLIDDEIYDFLIQLRAKVGEKGKILVVADACHSGGGSRWGEDSTQVVRGAFDDFVIPNAYAENYRSPDATRIEQWVFISACKSYQCNFEFEGVGSLTYALYSIRDDLRQLDAAQVIEILTSKVKQLVKFTQTPELNTCDILMDKTII